MKQLILALLDRPFPGIIIGRLFGFLRHKKTVMGLMNPLYVSEYFVERDGARYLAAAGTYLARQSTPEQIIRFDPKLFEPEISYLIRTLVRENDTVIDVGANVGLHTVAFARSAVNGQVLVFEPVAEMAERTSLNCALNGLKNVKLFNHALGEVTGEAKINVNVAGLGMEGTSSLLITAHVKSRPENYQPCIVPVRRLDDVIAEVEPVGRVSFIKIDTEGFEPKVLLGGMETIRKHRPTMIVEAHTTRLAQFGLSFQWYLDTFPDYHVLIISPVTAANPYLKLHPLENEPPEVSVNLLLTPRIAGLVSGDA
jgi:FkbM family methyltransferase